MQFQIHSAASAPEASRPLLKTAAAKYGFVPNLMGVLAASPAALSAYLGIAASLDQTRLTPIEREIVTLATSAANGCDYCLAAHSMVARMAGMPADVIASVASGRNVADRKLETLRLLVTSVVATRGRPSEPELRDFQAAGYDSAQLLDVLAIVAMKTLSNYTNHLARTPIDRAFADAGQEPLA